MTEMPTIPCPHCDTMNRLPRDRRAESGKCGKPLFTGHPIDLTEARFQRHAGAADLTSAALLGRSP